MSSGPGEEEERHIRLVEPPPEPPRWLLEIGDELERGIVIAPLGAGAYAQVFKTQHRFTKQFFADKVLEPSRTRVKKTVDSFLQEASVLANLRSPHIVRVHDVGATPSGLIFMRMDLLVGRTLFACRRAIGRLSAPLSLYLFVQLCSALAEAHRHELIHRDIKPENLFVEGRETRDNASLIVLDFGIAKMFGSAVASTDRVKTIRGTMPYLPPEALRGGGTPTKAYDTWSAGIVLFEMLADRNPFEESLDDPQLFASAVLTQPLPDVRRFAPDCPEYVLEILRDALAVEPERRKTAAQLGRAAEAALARFGAEVASGERWFEPPSERELEVFRFVPGEKAVDPRLWTPGTSQTAAIPRYDRSMAEELTSSRPSLRSYGSRDSATDLRSEEAGSRRADAGPRRGSESSRLEHHAASEKVAPEHQDAREKPSREHGAVGPVAVRTTGLAPAAPRARTSMTVLLALSAVLGGGVVYMATRAALPSAAQATPMALAPASPATPTPMAIAPSSPATPTPMAIAPSSPATPTPMTTTTPPPIAPASTAGSTNPSSPAPAILTHPPSAPAPGNAASSPPAAAASPPAPTAPPASVARLSAPPAGPRPSPSPAPPKTKMPTALELTPTF